MTVNNKSVDYEDSGSYTTVKGTTTPKRQPEDSSSGMISNLRLFFFFFSTPINLGARRRKKGCKLEEAGSLYADSGAHLQVQLLSPGVTYSQSPDLGPFILSDQGPCVTAPEPKRPTNWSQDVRSHSRPKHCLEGLDALSLSVPQTTKPHLFPHF